jgi:hypothetical protein
VKEYWHLELFAVAACCIDYLPILAVLFLGLAVSAYVPGVGLTVTLIVALSLFGKMFWGHIVISDRGNWWPFRLVAANSLWERQAARYSPRSDELVARTDDCVPGEWASQGGRGAAQRSNV